MIVVPKHLTEQFGTEFLQLYPIKQAELKKKSLLERLEELQNDKADDTITFEQLGIDRLYVGDAHYYKNLFTYTKMQNIPGISTTDARKTTDMYEKCCYLHEINTVESADDLLDRFNALADRAAPVVAGLTAIVGRRRYESAG